MTQPPADVVPSGLVHAQVRDRVDGLGGEASRLVQAVSSAADLDGLGSVWEVDAGGVSQSRQGPDLESPVVTAGGVRDGRPGQPRSSTDIVF